MTRDNKPYWTQQPDEIADWNSKYQKHKLLAAALAKQSQLRFNQISKSYFEALNNVKNGINQNFEPAQSLDKRNYHQALKRWLLFEEANQIVEMRQYDQTNARIKVHPLGGETTYKLKVEGVSKGHPSLIAGDMVLLEHGHSGKPILVRIIDVTADDHIVLHLSGQWASVEAKFNASFISAGVPFTICHKALDEFKLMRSMKQILFASHGLCEMKHPFISVRSTNTPDLISKLQKLNDRQRRAVVGILEAKCRPNPYIMFGPPGTGKTSTLIETVKQIRARDPNKRVLVCANSNNCVDQIADKMKGARIRATRFRAGQRARSSQNASVSNLFEIQSSLRARPDKVFLEDVVLTTNIMAGNLCGYQFDYVFVDEAGHANEAEALVPICRLAPGGCLVLAGDPKQLGPVVQLRQAEPVLGPSIMQRMADTFGMYKKSTNGYDENCITKLLVSYRCDPRILAPSNSLFYDQELHCTGQCPAELLRALNLRSPLVFLNTLGEERRPRGSTSYCNQLEAEICNNLLIKFLMMGLKPHQLSVITTYRRQMNLISEIHENELPHVRPLLDRSFKVLETISEREARIQKEVETYLAQSRGLKSAQQLKAAVARIENSPRLMKPIDLTCKIDTVDAFQGDEREVIIISTVRTDPNAGGFIHDAKRFNVALSRAKWLVIVVGNREALASGSYWPVFLRNATNTDHSIQSNSQLQFKQQ